MSNDLISRSVLLEKINSYSFDTLNADKRRGEHEAKAHICKIIENQPAVYNYDKIVKKIEDRRNLLQFAKIPKSAKIAANNAFLMAIEDIKPSDIK